MIALELLSPAKNLACGIAAIDHGADAVYIGASRFGARQAACNKIEDIQTLCTYAHQFGVSVHVTVNTIVYEQEMDDTLSLIRQLVEIGVDALLIQDMGILKRCLEMKKEYGKESFFPSLHASTQCDTRTSNKVHWLSSLGFDRVVLARELSLDEISRIHHDNPDVELETFVHGALCVSYSGVCYASQYCFHRSANRGECAQFCRLKFDLKDADGKLIEQQRHLLSLKDMCQIDHIEELAQAGARAFKIEGRLKDADYVKNVVAAYSIKLDEICRKYPNQYCRASKGRVEYSFAPNLKKTFNRGFTNYFLNGRQPNIASFDTPKAMGEYVGKVKEIRGNSFNVAGTACFANGDGLCFINDEHELEGFRVNKAVGNRLFPLRMPEHLRPGLGLYRNNDEVFEKQLSGKSAERRIPIQMKFGLIANGFALDIDEVHVEIAFEHQTAKKPQRENIVQQLSKLGNTPFICDDIDIEEGADSYFIPSSLLSDLRKKAISAYLEVMSASIHPLDKKEIEEKSGNRDNSVALQQMRSIPHKKEVDILNWQPEYISYPYLYNISNPDAREFYEQIGLKGIQPAFEIKCSQKSVEGNANRNRLAENSAEKKSLIMQCRHCIRYTLGYCVKNGGMKPTWREPLRLELPDGRRFQLEFKCSECQMNVYVES